VEVEILKWMLEIVQDESDVPICLDSPSPATLVKALQFCKKPGIVNSVSLEGNKADIIFPVIADTEWGCIALLCDDKGIPNSVERRMEAFDGITAKSKQYGIDPSRLYIDPLVVTLSTNDAALTLFAECTRRIKERHPDIHVTSGLSNISFGLPARKLINQAFMVLAMNAGMDSAIVDPTNRDMMGLIYAADCLLEKDECCLEFIRAFRAGLIGPEQKKN
jgi:5-methyltetrahydrofolate corrinoid/iron sulfur protein methyltransferase